MLSHVSHTKYSSPAITCHVTSSFTAGELPDLDKTLNYLICLVCSHVLVGITRWDLELAEGEQSRVDRITMYQFKSKFQGSCIESAHEG